MTSRDTIYETLTSKTGKKNPATDIERWRARQLASALADMAYLNDVECEKTEDGLTFHASNGNRVGIITGNPYETKKGSDMFLVNAVEPVRDINGENCPNVNPLGSRSRRRQEPHQPSPDRQPQPWTSGRCGLSLLHSAHARSRVELNETSRKEYLWKTLR